MIRDFHTLIFCSVFYELDNSKATKTKGFKFNRSDKRELTSVCPVCVFHGPGLTVMHTLPTSGGSKSIHFISGTVSH